MSKIYFGVVEDRLNDINICGKSNIRSITQPSLEFGLSH